MPATAGEHDRFEVRATQGKGRGLFATRRIRKGTLLMTAPVLVIPSDQRDALGETIVTEYVYEWDDAGAAGLVLGVSSMCNHDPEPNAHLWLVPDEQMAELWSVAPIAAGEEITVSYRASGDVDDPLWFDPS